MPAANPHLRQPVPLAKQAYLELDNPNPTAVDISGWKLTGAATLTFRPGARPPRSALYPSVWTTGMVLYFDVRMWPCNPLLPSDL